MGRNNKIDLRYFPVDVDILRDKKVRRLTRKYARGAEFYLYLLCAIYSDKGYYMPIDDGTAFDIADDMRVAEAEIDEMLDFCMSDNVGLFSREMKDKYHILTSRGIQRRYAETIRQLKRKVSINPEYSLINSENAGNSSELFGICRRNSEEIIESSEENRVYSEEMTENSEEIGINSDKSKVKESKVEESREEGYTHSSFKEGGCRGKQRRRTGGMDQRECSDHCLDARAYHRDERWLDAEQIPLGGHPAPDLHDAQQASLPEQRECLRNLRELR